MGRKNHKKPKSIDDCYRGQSHDELMGHVAKLLRQSGVKKGDRRGQLIVAAKRLRRVYLRSTGCSRTANRKAYLGVKAQLTEEERRHFKRNLARARRNVGTYPIARRGGVTIAG